MHGTKNQSQFGERGKGHIVITPESRGPDGWYFGLAGAEVFEVWADVARLYRLDPRKTAVTGYSMGGYGTYKFATQFPDLFASGQPTVGPPVLGISGSGAEGSDTNPMLPSLRHVPFMSWVGVEDELVPYAGSLQQRQAMPTRGSSTSTTPSSPPSTSRSRSTTSTGRRLSSWASAGSSRIPRTSPTSAIPRWTTRTSGPRPTAPTGCAASRPRATGSARSTRSPTASAAPTTSPGAPQDSAGVLTGGVIPALAFERQSMEVTEGGDAPEADELDLDAQNVASIKVYVKQARLSCDPDITHTGDGPLEVKLVGCPGAPLQLTP